jgi:glutamate dehydrogenase
LGRIVAAVDRIPVSDHFEGLALARSLDEISEARRIIASTALDSNPDAADPAGTWLAGNKDRISHVRSQILALTDSGELSRRKTDSGRWHDERSCPILADRDRITNDLKRGADMTT